MTIAILIVLIELFTFKVAKSLTNIILKLYPMSRNSIKIFCLPFAGGSSYSYQRFDKFFINNHQLLCPELPGRGRRSSELLKKNIHDIVDDIFNSIKNQLLEPYAIYGHSMGALLGYLLTLRILQEGKVAPLHLFFSGREAPSLKNKKELRYNLPQSEFYQILNEMGGCPKEILSNVDMMEFFEPIIRADFEAVETYAYTKQEPFDIPIDIMVGHSEGILEDDIKGWQDETIQNLQVTYFKGDHFFIYENEEELVNLISKKLNIYGK